MERQAEVGSAADAHNLSDLAVFNRWLCVSRLRAAGGILLFVGLLKYLHIGNIPATPVMVVCAGLVVFSTIVLGYRRIEQAPRVLFHSQHLIDLIAVTVGIGTAASGTAALLFRLIYVLVIVPPSLVSVSAGLLVATGASLGHETLLLLDRGAPIETLTGLESILPVFLFFLVAQQCFFYAQHLKEKNAALAQLASHLQWSRQRLAGLVDVARTLNSTLDAPELWARVNQAALTELDADWAATFLVNRDGGTFRAAAVSHLPVTYDALAFAELPMNSWPVLARLAAERVITFTYDDAQHLPALLPDGGALRTFLLAGLYRDNDLVGFLALGYRLAGDAAAHGTLDQLNAIVEHATIALRNAQLLEDARQASVMKSEFLSTVSHELRTPLNVIIGYTEMLRDGAVGILTSPQQEIFQRIDSQARGLFELIEATLQVGRIETGRDAVILAGIPMPELIGTLHAVVSALPRSAAIAFEWDPMPDVSGSMMTDTAKIVLILRNLVSNAFKFTTEGRVVVRLRTQETRLILTVTDTGIGIPTASLPVIFEMFRQLDSGAARQRGGVGLGLYIVKRMVERLNGTIVVESQPGSGSEFCVTLPGYEVAEPGVAREAQHRVDDSGHARHQDRDSQLAG